MNDQSVIPFIYTLRKGIRFQEVAGSYLVISETPLNIIRVSRLAYEVLQRCDGSHTSQQISSETCISEEQLFKFCNYFNKRAILKIQASGERAHWPSVSVIIPVKDRSEELRECLNALSALDYRKENMEIIVVDDGSTDRTSDVAHQYKCVLVNNSKSRGQSFCRNRGARIAHGEIIAFLDSDCVPDRKWLEDLVPYFRWEKIGAVGGYVDGYFEATSLDRYEKICSPLNMGKHIIFATNEESTTYMPTCNLLVRKKAFMDAGGIRETLRVGEDVDFCWRLRKKGYDTLYIPKGIVYHRHRSSLLKMLRRRADYGTSEAILYGIHSEKKKNVQVPLLATCSFFFAMSALTKFSPLPLLVSLGCLVFEASMKLRRIGRINIDLGLWKLVFSVARKHFSLFYFISFHIIRYYAVLLFCLGFLIHSLWYVLLFTLLLSAFVDYHLKGSRLAFPLFLFYYVVDHVFYQLGVFAGCLREKSFRSYSLRFLRKTGTNYVLRY